MMKRALRCHDFRSDQGVRRSQYVDIGEEHDAEMGEKSCQPFGLWPESALTASASLTVSTYGLRRPPCHHQFWLQRTCVSPC